MQTKFSKLQNWEEENDRLLHEMAKFRSNAEKSSENASYYSSCKKTNLMVYKKFRTKIRKKFLTLVQLSSPSRV